MTRAVGVLTLAIAVSAASQPVLAQVQAPPRAGAPSPLVGRYLDGERGVSLDEAIRRTWEQSPALAAARADVAAARGALLQAGLRMNPMATTSYQADPGGMDKQGTVMVQWPLDLFRRSGRVAVASRDLEARTAGVSEAERQAAAQVRTAYGQALVAIRNLDIADQAVQVLETQEQLVAARAQAGAAPVLERNLLTVERQRMEADRALLAGRAESAMIQLRRAMGLAPDVPLTLSERLDAEAAKAPDGVASSAAGDIVTSRTASGAGATNGTSERSDVQQARAGLARASAQVDAAQRESRFDVSLFASYTRMTAGFPQRAFAATGGLEPIMGRFNYVMGGANITLPWRNRNQGAIAAARADEQAATATVAAVQRQADADVAAARAALTAAQQAVALYATGVRPQARANLDVVRQTYDLGRATIFDVVNEQRRFIDIERAYTETLREAFDARAALASALGVRP